MKDFNGEEAERLLFHLYTGLPLLPAAETAGAAQVLARFGSYEVRRPNSRPTTCRSCRSGWSSTAKAGACSWTAAAF